MDKEYYMQIDFALNNNDNKNKKNEIEKQMIKDEMIEKVECLCHEAVFCESIDDIALILHKLDAIECEYVRMFISNFCFPAPEPFKNYIMFVTNIIYKFVPEWYKIPTCIDKTEQVNGFKLFTMHEPDLNESTKKWFHNLDECKSQNWIRYDYFLKLEKLFNEKNTMNKKEFLEKYNTTACIDWSKQNENGEYYSELWKYPEGSYERKHALDISRNTNGEALWNLPYSHSLIFETMNYGCNTGQESVRFTNFMCEYVKRKLDNKKNSERKRKNTEDEYFVNSKHLKITDK